MVASAFIECVFTVLLYVCASCVHLNVVYKYEKQKTRVRLHCVNSFQNIFFLNCREMIQIDNFENALESILINQLINR